MNAMKDAMAKAGFDVDRWEGARAAQIVDPARRRLMIELGLKPRIEPIKQVRVSRGVVRTSGGLQLSVESYEGRNGGGR